MNRWSPIRSDSIAIFRKSNKNCTRSYKGTPLQGSLQVSEILLNDFRVAAVPGAPFGVDANIRLSFATSREQLRKGLERFRDFVASVR